MNFFKPKQQHKIIQSNKLESLFQNSHLLDPRDMKIIQGRDQIQQSINKNHNIEKIQEAVREWLVDVYEQSTSDAFNKYQHGQLDEGQAKAYATKNYLANLTLLMQSIKNKKNNLSQTIFKFIDQESKNIISQLILKYPQSEGKSSAKKLKKAIERPDNKEKDQFDLLLNPKITGIEFKYKENGNYSSQIIKTLNYVMQIATKPLHQTNQFDSNFDGFKSIFENVFTMSGCESFQNNFLSKSKEYQQKKDNQQKVKMFQELLKTQDKAFEEYKKVIEKQCHYKIAHKIPSSVNLFTKQEIKSGIFRVPDVSILRVMAKWVEQLREKITSNYQLIKKRAQKFKSKNGQLLQLNIYQKQALYQAIKQQQIHIQNVTKILKQHYEGIVTKILQDSPKSLYTNYIDGAIGIFAARTQTCIGKYMFEYLNTLICSLMRAPIKAKAKLKHHDDKQKSQKQLEKLNLISFKIGDLLRAKCRATQKHIINIFKFLNKINEKNPKIIRFVRVKDRLDGKDNDLLINLFFMGKFQCEIQLQVSNNINQKHQYYNSFNHFIYQLKRAQFGPIAQCACILSQYDPVIKNYCQRQQLSPKIKQQDSVKSNRELYSNKNNEKQIINNLPYFCSVCNKFDSNKNYKFYQNKISQKNFKQCNNCYQNYLKEKSKLDLMKQLLRQQYNEKEIKTLIKHFQILKLQNINSISQLQSQLTNGLIIPKNQLKPNPKYFDNIYYDQKLYLVSAYEKDSKIKGKIQCQFNIINKFNKKKFQQLIIIKVKDKNANTIYNQNNKIVHKCNCCQKANIQLGKSFNRLQFVKLSQIQKIYKDINKNLKESMNVTNKDIQRQLKVIIDKQIKNVKIFNGSNNSIQQMSFIKNISNVQQIEISK